MYGQQIALRGCIEFIPMSRFLWAWKCSEFGKLLETSWILLYWPGKVLNMAVFCQSYVPSYIPTDAGFSVRPWKPREKKFMFLLLESEKYLKIWICFKYSNPEYYTMNCAIVKVISLVSIVVLVSSEVVFYEHSD